MKNLNDVQKEIRAIENLSTAEIAEMKNATWKRMKKKLELLRLLVIYLETNPTEEFVKAEIKRVESIVSEKTKVFDFRKAEYIELGVAPKEITKLKNKHESLYDIKKMRTQVRNLRMLLK